MFIKKKDKSMEVWEIWYYRQIQKINRIIRSNGKKEFM